MDLNLEYDQIFNPPLDPLPPQTTSGNANESSSNLGRDFGVYPDTPIAEPVVVPLGASGIQPKIGGRFSKDVVHILKGWITCHKHHPYPTDEEMELLQYQTGLKKAQIVNWFANARRRGIAHKPQLHTIPMHSNTTAKPMDIIQRPGTPAFRPNPRSLNPLERWVESPPEHEPASASAIARAVASSPKSLSHQQPLEGPYPIVSDGWPSPYAVSSASSGVTSRSSQVSDGSAHSYASSTQFSHTIASLSQRRRARKPRHPKKRPVVRTWMQYQCTFCTQTFKTKHDWQRHEKSLHLPLEQWICAPHGSRIVTSEGQSQCVFCGHLQPDDAHMESHNFSLCHDRAIEERMFHRKDHLRQHLQLVHNADFKDWLMGFWLAPTPPILSRCGFCGIQMSSWTERADHLADHFKSGKTMADWQGDWGFEDAIQKLVESAIPPYLIDFERCTPAPFAANTAPASIPPNAYELLKLELENFLQDHFDQAARMPTNDELQLEACRIIFTSEVAPTSKSSAGPSTLASTSWLRDLILSSDEIAQQARFGPIRARNETQLSLMGINSKKSLFDNCPLESELQSFVLENGQQSDGTVLIADEKIQEEAHRIIERMEYVSATPSDIFANWLIKLVYSSNQWLMTFRYRNFAGGNGDIIVQQPPPIMAPAFDLGLPQAQLDSPFSTAAFPPIPSNVPLPTSSLPTSPLNLSAAPSMAPTPSATSPVQNSNPPTTTTSPSAFLNDNFITVSASDNTTAMRSRPLVPNNTNFYRWFVRDLLRWTTMVMSPNNPSSHVPSDVEIQHQARWILYDDDDPWNQSAADNVEWLTRFKRDAGILKDGGPGLALGLAV